MRPTRVRQSSRSSAIAVILLVTTIFITLPAQALVLPGPSELPPDPGVAGEAAIDGIDVNVNGVRDDLELVLFAQYGNNPSVREILYHMAIYYQAMLRQPTNATVVLNNFGFLTAYSRCLESITGSASQEDNMLRPEVLNTYDRSVAYITAMDTITNVVSIPLKTVTCNVLPAYPDVPPTSPSSVTVPASSTTGTYTISWSTAVGTVTKYELQQDTSSSFAAPVTVYSGAATSSSATVTQNGTYYYRVRACNGATDSSCSNYRTGANGIVLSFPENMPTCISVPATSTTGTYTISWCAASGAVTSYELVESTTTRFCFTPWFCMPLTAMSYLWPGTAGTFLVSDRPNGTYSYKVRSCINTVCGDYRVGTNSVVVSRP